MKSFILENTLSQIKIQSINRVVKEISTDLVARLDELKKNDKLLEAQRLEQRTNFDLEMMMEVGYCSGIENYSRYFSGRKPGERPYTLIDFFPNDFITIIDESHVSLPQIQAMYNGDRARKMNLVEHGFRLPSALDNRPMKINEFFETQNQLLYVSATPSNRELELAEGVVVEQLIRPTGLLDPIVEVRKSDGQIDDLINEIKIRVKTKERVLITTLTKRMSEDLTDYLRGVNLKVRYLHSEIDTLERVQILRDLRLGEFDVLVGINLLREGLDLPEVSLVAVIDADKEGFLRSKSSLMQVAGRAARNMQGKVILYADKISEAMQYLIDESSRRRDLQKRFNLENDIIPSTINKLIDSSLMSQNEQESDLEKLSSKIKNSKRDNFTQIDKKLAIEMMREEMLNAAENYHFEKAAKLRDEISLLEKEVIGSV